MSDQVNIVVTCTKQKTLEPPSALRLGALEAGSPRERARLWASRINSSDVEPIPARRLYAGDHWAVARDLPELSTPKRQINLWVISAGYGVVSIDQPMLPYSATFSSPHPDSVIDPSLDIQKRTQKVDWWTTLINQEWPREQPYSLASLAAEYPDTPMIVAASRNYLTAVYDDLLDAREMLNESNLLSIISAGTAQLDDLTGSIVPADGKLRHYVGGILRSLNVRLMRHILKEMPRGKLTLKRITAKFHGMLDAAPELTKFDRTPMTDSAVRNFIRLSIRKRPKVGHTPLLRELRASGNACEQKRFRQLFLDVKESLNG